MKYYLRETFSLELFHSIEIFIQRCTEMMRMEKNLTRLWAKRMHTSLRCYKENLIYLFAMEKKILAHDTAYKQNGPIELEKPKSTPTDINLDSEEELVSLAENLLEASNNPLASTKKDGDDLDVAPPKPKSLLDERTTELMTKLKDQLFYIQEFRELFLTMLKDFDQSKMSK